MADLLPEIDDLPADRPMFAKNLDFLIRLVGMSRKDAAKGMGVQYKVIRRYVSAGISRPNYRSYDNLEKVTAFFGLPSIYSLWQEDLAKSLLTTEDGRPFVAKFRSELKERLENERAKASDKDERQLNRLESALDGTTIPRPSRAPISHLEKARAILEASWPKRRSFCDVVELYYNALQLRAGYRLMVDELLPDGWGNE